MEESEWLMEFGDNLLTMLSRRGMTQADLAESTGLTKQAISNYVHLKRVPSITAIINMSYALGCSVDELVDFGEPIE